MAESWLPSEFEHPLRVELSTGHHLRPIRACDVDLDMPAVMGLREEWLDLPPSSSLR
jgi:hypothetical protein